MGRFAKVVLAALVVCLPTARSLAEPSDLPSQVLKVINYDIVYQPDFINERLSASCEMTVVNPNNRAFAHVPLLLYRLLSVDSILDESGLGLPFEQRVVTFEDWSVMQQNCVRVRPVKGLAAEDTLTFTVFYSGHLLGYAETGMMYVRDRIDTAYTVLRPDCGAYPEIGYPSTALNRAAGMQTFDYNVTVTVPKPLIAANGGELVRETVTDDSVTFQYKNVKPSWRIDVAIAPYALITNDTDRVYFFPADSLGARVVMGSLKETLALFTEWWGPLSDYRGFAVIEIPDGWGSQADVTAILQQAGTFKDPKELRQLYHEISHQWNVRSNDTYPPRWEEGLATFIEFLVLDRQTGERDVDRISDWFLGQIQKELADSAVARTALVDFGEFGMTGYSYSMGMLLFRVLYDLAGPEEFNRILREFKGRYAVTGATTDEFAQHLASNASVDLKRFVHDWILSADYARVVSGAKRVDEIVAAYR